MSIREELIQDIGLAVWQAMSKFKGNSSVKTYILRIAHNKCVDHVTKEALRNQQAEMEPDTIPIDGAQESLMLMSEQQAQLFKAIRQLNLPLRQVITLLLEDLSYQEIADALDIAVSNVGVRVNRAKQQLKDILQP